MIRSSLPPGHPERGTCIPGCPDYGYCHCGCGKEARIATSNSAPQGIVKGHPFVFVFRHRIGRVPNRVYSPVTGHSERVSTLPLRTYMTSRWHPAYEGGGEPFVVMQRQISEVIGVTTRQVARWQKQIMENEEIALEIADAMCVGLGLPFAYLYAATTP